MQKNPKVSIILVHYKAKKALFKCIKSVLENHEKTPYEIIVVDNDEKKTIGPGIQKKYPQVIYLESPGNIGYGAGNNLGVSVAKGEYLFILNPDTLVSDKALDILVKFMQNKKKAGIIAPTLLDEKYQAYDLQGSQKLTPLRGIIALSFLNKLFPNNPISKRYFLKDINRIITQSIDVVGGSAFLIRKDLFELVGGFDENFFLYFEESDLCKRVQEKGFKIYIIPEAKVVHLGGVSTPKDSEKIKKVFSQSRFYFFKKHYGIFWATLVHLFATFSIWHAIFILSLAAGITLRFYCLKENLVFHGELGSNYLDIKNFISKGEIPLLGPPTSHSWLSFGPLFYWIFAPILVLFNYNPISGAYFMAVAGSLVIVLNFIVLERLFDKKIAAISSFLLAISPQFVTLTRESRFFSLVPLFFYPFLYFFVKIKLFWAGLFLGLMLNFHLTPLIFFPAILVILYLKRPTLHKYDLLKGLVGLIIPNIPFLIYNFKNGFNMLTNLILWIPYRLMGFVGLYPKNNFSLNILGTDFLSLNNFLGKSIISENNIIALLLVISSIIYLILKYRKAKEDKFTRLALILIFTLGILGIFIHGDPPSHYYLPLYPLPILFLTILLVDLLKVRVLKYLVFVFLIYFGFINLHYYFSEKWFYKPQNRMTGGLEPYSLQLDVSRQIISDAKGQKFTLARVGDYDYFEGNYAQNYHYLLWWMGNEPVVKSSLKYIIYESSAKVPKDSKGQTWTFGDIVLAKEKSDIKE